MVHLFTGLGKHIALDVGSGAVHVLSPDAFALLNTAIEHNLPITQEYPEILQSVYPGKHDAWYSLHDVYSNGMLFAPDTASTLGFPDGDTPLKALCLHVAHDCNLRCGYCFADTGTYHDRQRGVTDCDTARKAIDYLVSRSGKRRNLEVDFFGGEPLMALDTVKNTVEYARNLENSHDKRFRFTLTTNGLLLDDDAISFINAEMSNIVLSLDGRPEVNDKLRRTPDGKGSYAKIAPLFQKLASERKGDWFVRGTFTSKNLDFSNDVLHLADTLGLRNISIEPVVLPEGHPLAIREDHLPLIFAEYERLAEIMTRRNDFLFFHYNVDLEQGPCVYKRLRGCGSGYEYAAVTPDGGVYPCHQFAGRPEFKMGDVSDNSFDTAISRRFAKIHVHSRTACSVCWAKYYCSGGCSAANLNTSGDIDTPYSIGCQLERKRLECAIALKASKS